MGSNKDRNRQKRLQRKRAKRAAKRAQRNTGVGGFVAPSDFRDSPWELPESAADVAVQTCVQVCVLLLSDCRRLDDELRQEAVQAAREAGGIWARLAFELEAFLCADAAWTMTCAELEPVRRAFARYTALEVFNRLWSLGLTLGPDAARQLGATTPQSCAHRAALAFDALRLCLDDPAARPAGALQSIAREMKAHDAPEPLRNAYQSLLTTAVDAVHAPVGSEAIAIGRLAHECRTVFDQGSRELTASAWWHCGRLFLREAFERLELSGHAALLAEHLDLGLRVFDAPDAMFRTVRHGARHSFRAIHVQSTADSWLRFLQQRIDPIGLPFEDRLRYEIARLKLLRAHAHSERIARGAATAVAHEFLDAFEHLRALLAHGVPRDQRALPGLLEPLLIDFYVESVVQLSCEDNAVQTSEALLRQHRNDFRVACLYATGMLANVTSQRFSLPKSALPWTKFNAELFARCAAIWAQPPPSAETGTTLRALLFDPLDREQRKQCLIHLARLAFRRAVNADDYREQLGLLLPYFARDGFVYGDLRERAELESELIFLATMMAPIHRIMLSLSDGQSQQWLSHAVLFAAQSPLAAALARRQLQPGSRWFTLVPAVRRAAIARLTDSKRKFAPRLQAAAQPAVPASRAKTRHRKPSPPPPQQPGLFDDLGP